MFWGILATVLNLCLNIWLIPSYGILGAAVVTIISYVLFMVGVSYRSFEFLPFSIKTIVPLLVTMLSLLVYASLFKLDVGGDVANLFVKGSLGGILLVLIVLVCDNANQRLGLSALTIATPGCAKMIWLFFIAAFFCVYTYAIFPLWLHFRARSVSLPARQNVSDYPSVSVIIAAHNEQANVASKLASLQALDYPEDKIELVFVSDGSNDDTLNLLNAAKANIGHLRVEHYMPAAGKPTALNKGVEIATGEVLVFMDARQRVSTNAITALVERLMQPQIGVVSGELALADDNGVESVNVGLYWQYEKWIRLNESKLFSTTGATGALYAIRRDDFIPHKSRCVAG